MNVELLRGKTLETGIVLDQAPIAQRETSAIFLGESRIRHVGGRPEAMAVKVFNTDAQNMDEGLARREGHIHLAFGGHPNIITSYGYSIKEVQDPVSGEFLQFPVLAMEYASEHSVKERLHTGEISLSDAVRIASETAYALQSVHDGGYVHRDVKPQNIGLIPAIDGEARYHARLLDFGIAMRINPLGDETDEERTITQQTRQGFGGTPDFIAPEQLRLKAEYVSDEWSLAEVMKRMMAGKYHDALEAVVEKGHQEDPEDRYPHIAEFGEELVRAHSGKDLKSTYIDLGSVRTRLSAEAQAVKGQSAVNTARSAELDARDAEQAETAQRLASEAAAQTTKEEQFARQYQLRDEQLNALTDLRAAQRVVGAAQNNREEELRTQAGELDDRRRALSSGESQLKGEREDFAREIEQTTGALERRAEKMDKEEAKRRKALDKEDQRLREKAAEIQRTEEASLRKIKEERELLTADKIAVVAKEEEVTAREQDVAAGESVLAARITSADIRDSELDAKAEGLTIREGEIAKGARANEEWAGKLHIREESLQEREADVVSAEQQQRTLAQKEEMLRQREERIDVREQSARDLEGRVEAGAAKNVEESRGLAAEQERLARPKPQRPLPPEKTAPRSSAELTIVQKRKKNLSTRYLNSPTAVVVSGTVLTSALIVAGLLVMDTGGENENPKDEVLESRGIELDKKGKSEESIKLFNDAIKLDPKDKTVYFSKGDALLHLGENIKAIDAYNKAIKLDSDNNFAYHNRGLAQFRLGKYEEAIESYDKSAKLDPKHAFLAYVNKGDAFYELKKYKEAVISYDDAIKLNHENKSAYSKKADTLLKLKKNTEAVAAYDKVIELDPKDFFAYHNKGVALARVGKYTEAITMYDKTIELNPDGVGAYANKSVALDALGRTQEAEKMRAKAKELEAKQKNHRRQ